MKQFTSQWSRPGLSGLVGVLVLAVAMLTGSTTGYAQVFAQHNIPTSANSAQSVFATDVDGDGNVDVLLGANSTVYWYESDGRLPPAFTERIISTDSALTVFAADIDGDDDVDVLSTPSGEDEIAWYENDGSKPPTFIERIISTSANPGVVFATDVDGDGDTDVLSASFSDDTIAWYESDGALPPAFTERIITTSANGASHVFATDLDRDDDVDVLSSSVHDDTIAWYESDGGLPPSFTERIISTTAADVREVYATDVDGDGDVDVLSASSEDDKIAWYESDGNAPPTFVERIISASAISAQSVYAEDVDGDGHVDVLSASAVDNTIRWYENDGGLPPEFTARSVGGIPLPFSVYATDVDGDGDVDVLAAAIGNDPIAWYENRELAASVSGMRASAVRCENLVTDQTGEDRSHQGTLWTCGELGVSADLGDRVRLTARGRAQGEDAVGGVVQGLTFGFPRRVICQNLTTAQTIRFSMAVDSSWDCEARGLIVAEGDLIQQSVSGDR